MESGRAGARGICEKFHKRAGWPKRVGSLLPTFCRFVTMPNFQMPNTLTFISFCAFDQMTEDQKDIPAWRKGLGIWWSGLVAKLRDVGRGLPTH
jgi:hypothetical protein